MSATPRLLLGFDYGTKQIGVAVGQAITGQARELCVLKAQNGVPDWQKVEALIKEWQPDAIVVGLPLNMDGTKSEMSERAEEGDGGQVGAHIDDLGHHRGVQKVHLQ